MKHFDIVICSFIGAIGGRAVYNKDWFTLSLAILLLILFVVYDYLNHRQGD